VTILVTICLFFGVFFFARRLKYRLLQVVSVDHVDGFPGEVFFVAVVIRVAEELVSLGCVHEENFNLIRRELVLQRGRLFLRLGH